MLRIVFDRLYTLRNQVFHGGATFSAGWGQAQVHDGSRIMSSLVPAVLAIMQADIDRDPDTAVWERSPIRASTSSPGRILGVLAFG